VRGFVPSPFFAVLESLFVDEPVDSHVVLWWLLVRWQD
jgi:hypothetical protein